MVINFKNYISNSKKSQMKEQPLTEYGNYYFNWLFEMWYIIKAYYQQLWNARGWSELQNAIEYTEKLENIEEPKTKQEEEEVRYIREFAMQNF